MVREHLEISKIKELIEIAQIAAAQDGEGTSQNIKNYGIKDEKALLEIAEIVAAQYGREISENIENYGIKDEKALIRIAKIAAAQDSWATYENIGNYGIEDEVALIDIARFCLATEVNREINFDRLSHLISKEFIARNLPTASLFAKLLLQTSEIVIPVNFVSEEDEKKSVEQINKLFECLLNLAEKELKLSSHSLDWFKKLQINFNLQQQMKRIIWLNQMMVHCALYPELLLLFQDNNAIDTLLIIGELTDSLLLNGATIALLSLYKVKNEEQNTIWNTLIKHPSPPHLILTKLLLAFSRIELLKNLELLESLSASYYANYEVLNPINEMIYLLGKEESISPKKRSHFLENILLQPAQENQRKNEWKKLIGEQRKKQKEWVIAARDLLFFGKGNLLSQIEDNHLITEHWQNACHEIFGISCDQETLTRFSDTFRHSKRYPGGLFTYTARLHLLQNQNKSILIKLLGEYVSGVLNGHFPHMRYDLKKSKHLNTIFCKNESLLEKWKTQLSFSAEEILSKIKMQTLPEKSESPQELTRRLIKLAVDHGHLGLNANTDYPNLHVFKDWDNITAIRLIMSKLREEQNLLSSKKSLPKDMLIKKKKLNSIEIYCFQLLDPNIAEEKLKELLRTLYNNLPDGMVFKEDIKGILETISAQKTPQTKWIVQDSDEWEDMLLMGTEVNNSCQKITGEPEFNKCLLAYIHDGKNRLVVVKDASKKIIARAVLRLLWDKNLQQPVVFLERLYTSINSSILKSLVCELAQYKAKQLGMPLVAITQEYSDVKIQTPYPGILDSLEGPTPFEYVDALGGIKNNGEFSILKSFILS